MSYNYNIWYETYDPIFSDISKQSRLPNKWISYQNINNKKYSHSFIKPINKYVEMLYPCPRLISIDDNIITLRQHNHAEFFLLNNQEGFYNLDRPWMRQYYQTRYSPDIPENCFPKTYKFYVPWYIDLNTEIRYTKTNVESPFFIYENNTMHNNINKDAFFLEPDFVYFNFKSVGTHMVDSNFGKIARNQPMFDIVFNADDIIVERVREFYEKN